MRDDYVVLEPRCVAVKRKLVPNHGPGALLRPQRAHEGEPLRLFFAQHAGAGVEARLGLDRFGTEQHRRQHDLVIHYHAIDVAVMSIELPAPRRGRLRLTENADPVEELAE